MKKPVCFILVIVVAVTLFVFTACKEQKTRPVPESELTKSTQATTPEAGFTGKVTETINAASYTYIQIQTEKGTIWAATSEIQVKVGDQVFIPLGTPMKNFQSKTLNRTFDLIYFVPGIIVNGQEVPSMVLPPGHPSTAQGDMKGAAPKKIDLSGIETPQGGTTIARIYAKRTELSGKAVKIRGKVVKFSADIMGKNWIHVQDGTGSKESQDLTISTADMANVGDTILVNGVVVVDKDLGFGYQYEVLLEDATVKVE